MTDSEIRAYIISKFGYSQFTLKQLDDALKGQNVHISYGRLKKAIVDFADEGRSDKQTFSENEE